MAILNITYKGLAADYRLEGDDQLSDADIRRIAAELVRSGGLPGLYIRDLPHNAFANFVVDRVHGRGETRIYLRPKVPFGQAVA